MKRILKNIAIKSPLLIVFLVSANMTYAAPGDLVVDFETTPLFSEASFMPGGEAVKWVKVSNNTPDSHTIVAEAINKINPDGLGDFLNLKIKDGGTVLYDDSLSNFLNAGEVVLTILPSNTDTTYDFMVGFDSSAGNSYQEKNLGFDLLIGFQGQSGEQADDAEFSVSSGSSSSGLGSLGGSGGPYQGLLISNDSSPSVLGNDVTITWNTSYYSTSQVIFGPESGAPYNLNIALPNFGYASSSPDFLDKVINHSVTIYGLPPGSYLYRVVSHASPPTISFEHSFVVSAGGTATDGSISSASPSQVAQNNAPVSKKRTSRNIVVALIGTDGIAPEETVSNDNNQNIAEKITVEDIINGQKNISKEPSANNSASVLSALDEALSGSLKYILIFLFIVFIIWIIFFRRKES